MVNNYMRKFAQELDLPPEIAQDVGGKYMLPMDEETMVDLLDVPPGFALRAKVCSVPERNLEPYFEHVLHGNLLGQGTAGGVLGLTDDAKSLTLSLDIDYAVSYNEFKDIVEAFFNTVDYWREETRNMQAGKKS